MMEYLDENKYYSKFNEMGTEEFGDTFMNVTEVPDFLREMGWSEKEHPDIKDWFPAQEKVCYMDMMNILRMRPIEEKEVASIRLLFKAHDTDGDGSVTEEELFKYMGACTHPNFQKRMKEVAKRQFKTLDENKDGKITVDEFISKMAFYANK